jgi:beta-phosphoglucomutase-like phosphatase (HAD superfamily)
MPLPRPPRAVIFDMDGLLFDTEVLYRDAFFAAARDMGRDMPEPVFHSLIGLPGESSRRLLLDHFGEDFDVDGLWDTSSTHFHALARGQDFLKAGVREFLDLLDALALPRAIATSSRHEDVAFNLGRHGWKAVSTPWRRGATIPGASPIRTPSWSQRGDWRWIRPTAWPWRTATTGSGRLPRRE